MTYHPFSKSFSFKKNVFLSVTFGYISAAKSLEKKGASRKPVSNGGHVTRPGSPRSDGPRRGLLQFFSDLRSAWMWFKIILIYRAKCTFYML
jgi:hypothetical protein